MCTIVSDSGRFLTCVLAVAPVECGTMCGVGCARFGAILLLRVSFCDVACCVDRRLFLLSYSCALIAVGLFETGRRHGPQRACVQQCMAPVCTIGSCGPCQCYAISHMDNQEEAMSLVKWI